MFRKSLLAGLVVGIVFGATTFGLTEDAEIKLNSNDGSTGFIIQDKDGVTVYKTDSDGNTVVKGTMTVQGSAFSVVGSTVVIKDGNVGIGTTNPGQKLQVVGNILAGDDTNIGTVMSRSVSWGNYVANTQVLIGGGGGYVVTYNFDNSGAGGTSGIFVVYCDPRYSPVYSTNNLVQLKESSEAAPTVTWTSPNLYMSFPYNFSLGGTVKVLKLN